jgi:uncharacterized protein YcsI (UPF0317 family)
LSGNLAILPEKLAAAFHRFCQLNPKERWAANRDSPPGHKRIWLAPKSTVLA